MSSNGCKKWADSAKYGESANDGDLVHASTNYSSLCCHILIVLLATNYSQNYASIIGKALIVIRNGRHIHTTNMFTYTCNNNVEYGGQVNTW